MKQFCLQLLCYCSHYQLHCDSLKRCLYDKTKCYNSGRYSLVGSVNCCGIIGTLTKPPLASGFCLFSFTFVTFCLEVLTRSCKIVHILGALDKNLAKILITSFHTGLPLARSIARETNCRRQLEKFKSHAYTHCRTKYLNFSVSQELY